MKKIIPALFVLALLFVTAKPAKANCITVKDQHAGYSYIKVTCTNPTAPVIIHNVVTSTTGNAVAISIVSIMGFNIIR